MIAGGNHRKVLPSLPGQAYNQKSSNLDVPEIIKSNDSRDSFDFGKGTGPRLNIKTVLSTYGDFHVKDKTAIRTSYL